MLSRETLATKYSDESVAARYHADRYSDWQGRMNQWFMGRAIISALSGVPKGGTVLDVPCGTGQYCWALAKHGFQTVASDISLAMIQQARNQSNGLGEVGFFRGDIFSLPFPDKSFDAAMCLRFTNLVGPELRVKAVQELARVAPIVVVSYYHPYTLKYCSRWTRQALGGRNKLKPRLTRSALRQEIGATGLRLERLITVVPVLSEAWIAVLRR